MNLRLASAALTLSRDAVAAEVCSAFEARGVHPILLKGASFAAWLYHEGTPRTYGDVDLLIDPDDGPVADEVLTALGFEPRHPRSWVFDRLPYGRPWRRAADDVDLHRAVWGIGATPEEAWSVLSEETDLLTVGRRAIPTLAAPGRALHVALHAAQNCGRTAKPLRDLSLAVELVSLKTWETAGELAHRLDAAPAMAGGLRMDPRGRDLADRLGLPAPTRHYLLPRSAANLAFLIRTPGVGAKAVMAADIVVPSRESMRARSALARRSRVGLALAYLQRAACVTGKAVIAVLTFLRLGRRVERHLTPTRGFA